MGKLEFEERPPIREFKRKGANLLASCEAGLYGDGADASVALFVMLGIR